MKKIFFPVLIAFISTTVFSQNTLLQRCLGGSGAETVGKSQVTRDSGYIIVGTAMSTDGDVSGIHVNANPELTKDIWVVKLSQYGGVQWQKCFGGSSAEEGIAIDTGLANTYFVLGYGSSVDGDFTGSHGASDGWVAKLNSNGSIIWKKTIGGSISDFTQAIRSTPDGGCVIVGHSTSSDGDVPGNHSTDSDGWVVKLDAIGNIAWSKNYGSTGREYFYDVAVTPDGKYVIAGVSNRNDGDVSGIHPGILPDMFDAWILKLDGNGSIIWKNCIGGDYNDDLHSVSLAPDGGYIFAGWSESSCCEQVSPNWPGMGGGAGSSKAWVVKIDSDGNFSWGKRFGSLIGYSRFADGIAVNDGYIFVGDEDGSGNDVQGPVYQWQNVWLAKISFTGSLIWQRVLGGNGYDWGSTILPYNAGYAITGVTESNNGDVNGYHPPLIPGYQITDFWFAKFTPFNTIKLNSYADLNSNGIKDAGEPFFRNYNAEVYKQNTLIETNYSLADDTMKIYVDTGLHIIKPISISPYYSPTPTASSGYFTSYNNVVTNTVAFKPTGSFNDLVVTIIPFAGVMRAGGSNVFRLYYENVGTTSIANPSIDFVKDARTTYLASSVTPTSIVNDTIKFNLSALSPLSKGYIDISVKNATTLLANDTVRHAVTILPISTDNTPADNRHTFTGLIVGSYDPNDKQESHGGLISKAQVTNGEYLNYTIRFQNTGNDTAFRVSIVDTLSSKYDLASLQMITSSHPFRLEVKGRTCTWDFPGIKLVDSIHNEPASHGFISYRIKARSDLNEGDTLKNDAFIYFDYNEPIQTHRTNTVVKVATVTAVSQVDDNSIIQLFPNPVTDKKVTVYTTYFLKGNVLIEIYNNSGTLLERQKIGKNLNGFTKQIDFNRYAAGQYFIIVKADKKTYVRKLIKIR